jgi:3-isopropylmalate/(R)-2-methylmalate dehydratase small subunit
VPFAIDHEIRHRLLGGLDDIGLTLQQGEAIDSYEHGREQREPRVPVTTAL